MCQREHSFAEAAGAAYGADPDAEPTDVVPTVGDIDPDTGLEVVEAGGEDPWDLTGR